MAQSVTMSLDTDCLIVGAGFAGLTIAERLATLYGKRSIVVEKRNHIGGNSADHYDKAGILVHTYGPHYFRTNAPYVKDYLGQFSAWSPINYKILAFTEGRYWNFPINLNTFEQLIGKASTTKEMEYWLEKTRVPIKEPSNSEEIIISQVGWELYQKFFKGYTQKQWRMDPKDLSPSVCGRIPIRTDRNDNYLKENFQALPKEGYSKMFHKMLASCSNKVQIFLNTDYREIYPHINFKHLVFTGPIDEYFDYCFGPLPYRSLRFEPESFGPEQLESRRDIAGKPYHWQPAMQVNYPNEEQFTRIVEIKHATGQISENTTIVREYPENYSKGKEAYYPIPASESNSLYQKYKELANNLTSTADTTAPKVSFVGRLATYRYYNMDQVVASALKEAQKIGSLLQT